MEPAGQRRCDRAGTGTRTDASVALGPILVAGAELAGVVAHLDDLDAPPLQVHAAGAQAEQLAAAQPAPDMDDEVVAVEGRAGRQEWPNSWGLKVRRRTRPKTTSGSTARLGALTLRSGLKGISCSSSAACMIRIRIERQAMSARS